MLGLVKRAAILCLALISPTVNAEIGDMLAVYAGHSGNIVSVAANSDYIISSAFDARIHRTSDNTLLRVDGSSAGSMNIDDQTYFVTNGIFIVRRWLHNGTQVSSFKDLSGISGLRFVEGSNDLLLSCGLKSVSLWAVNNRTLLRSFSFPNMTIRDCAADQNMSFFYTVADNLPPQQYDFLTGVNTRNYTQHQGSVFRVVLTGDILVSTSSSNLDETKIHNATSGRLLRSIPASGRSMVVYSGNVFVGENTGHISMFNLDTGSRIAQWAAHSSNVRDMYACDDFLVTGGIDNLVYRWDIKASTKTSATGGSAATPITLPLPGIGDSGSTIRSSTSAASIRDSTTASVDALNLPQLIGLSAGMVALLLVFVAWFIRRSRLKLIKAAVATPSASSGTQPFTTTTTTATSNLGTLLGSAHELSIPAFLNYQIGQDFVTGKFLLKGGGGSIYACDALSESFKKRIGEDSIIVKIVDQYGIDNMPNRYLLGFFQELSIMWRFRDIPFVAKMYGFSEKPAAMIMKYYKLGDLNGVIYKSVAQSIGIRYSKLLVLGMFRTICQGVRVLHQEGFAHCDLKPGNILLDLHVENGILLPVLTDFGITRVIDKNVLKVHAFEVADIKGLSLDYAAPEALKRFRTRKADVSPDVWKAGDVYALAIITLEFLTRCHPWGKSKSL